MASRVAYPFASIAPIVSIGMHYNAWCVEGWPPRSCLREQPLATFLKTFCRRNLANQLRRYLSKWSMHEALQHTIGCKLLKSGIETRRKMDCSYPPEVWRGRCAVRRSDFCQSVVAPPTCGFGLRRCRMGAFIRVCSDAVARRSPVMPAWGVILLCTIQRCGLLEGMAP